MSNLNNDETHIKGLAPHQVEHVMHLFDILSKRNRAIDASITGARKSYCAAMLANLLGLKPIVICPKSVIQSWLNVFAYFNIDWYSISNYEMIKNCKHYSPLNKDHAVECMFINKKIIQSDNEFSNDAKSEEHQQINNNKKRKLNPKLWEFVFDLPDDAILILDEAHKMKRSVTTNSKLLLAASKINNRCLLMSATIFDKIKLFAVFGVFFGFFQEPKHFAKWMQEKLIFHRIRQDICHPDGIDYNQRCLDVLHRELFPKFGRRMDLKEILHHNPEAFPETTVRGECYFLSKQFEVDRLYREIQQAFEDLKNKELRASALGKIQIIRMKIEILKIPIFVKQAQEILASGKSCLIFVNFSETLKQLAETLQTKCVVWGKQAREERDRCIASFQSNESKLIICNIQAGSTGISLHDVVGQSPRVSLISPSWNAVDMKQALGRTSRVNSKSKCEIIIVFVAKSYEETICKLVNKKLSMMETLLDGDLNPEQIKHENVLEDVENIDAAQEY